MPCLPFWKTYTLSSWTRLQWHPPWCSKEENVSWWRGLEERPVPSSQVMAVGPGQNKESYVLRLFFREKFPGWISGTTTARRSNLVLRTRKQYILTWTSAEDRLGPRKLARGFRKPARGFRITAPGPPACLPDCNRLRRSEHAQFTAVGVGPGTDSGQEAGPRHLAGPLAHPCNPQPRQNSRDLARMDFWKEGSQPARLPPHSIVLWGRPRPSSSPLLHVNLHFPPVSEATEHILRAPTLPCLSPWEALNTTHQTKPWLVASSLKYGKLWVLLSLILFLALLVVQHTQLYSPPYCLIVYWEL